MRQLLLIVSLTFVMFLSVFAKDVDENNPKEILQNITFYTESFPPFTYENENGVLEGYAVAIVEKVFENLDLNKPDIRLKVWDMAYMLTLISKNPSALFLVSETPEREKQFYFSHEMLKADNAIYCNKESKVNISTRSELRNYKYAVEKQDVNISLLRAEGVPEKNIVILGSAEVAFDHVVEGHINCVVFNQSVIERMIKAKGIADNEIQFKYRLPVTKMGVAFNHTVQDSVLVLFNQALSDVLGEKEFIAKQKKLYGVR